MISVRLPDGSQRQFDSAVTVAQVAASIGAGLAKAALAGKVNGKLVDTSYLIDSDVDLSIVTDKDADGLEVIRHSTAHLLAYAVKELFPEAQVTIGPVIENGFFYDFSYKRPFTPEDLAVIEKKMTELAKKYCRVMRLLPTLNPSAKLTRLRSSSRFLLIRMFPYTPKGCLLTCAAAHTYLRPVSSKFSN